MKKYFSLLLLAATLTLTASAQRYIGIRGGEFCNVSLRSFVDPGVAIEVNLTDRYNGFHVSMLQQKFRPLELPWDGEFVLYTGFGGHAGFASSRRYRDDWDDRFAHRWGPLVGVDFSAGAEYRFKKLPLTAGLDYNPFAEFSVADFFYLNAWNFGLTVRYCIN